MANTIPKEREPLTHEKAKYCGYFKAPKCSLIISELMKELVCILYIYVY